ADCFSNDIHKLCTSTMSWALVNTKGAPARWRDFHSATVIGSRMFVFGGRADRSGPFHSNNEIYCNRIRVFDMQSESWLEPPQITPPPEGRRSHSACDSFTSEAHLRGQQLLVFKSPTEKESELLHCSSLCRACSLSNTLRGLAAN
ncbi:hypothetical protein FKM82_026936, partial [Ascaphus truei]